MKFKSIKTISDIVVKKDECNLVEEFDRDDFPQGIQNILAAYGLKSYKYNVANTAKEKQLMPLNLAVYYQPDGKHIIKLLHETGHVMDTQHNSLGYVVYLVDGSKKNIFICPEDENDFFFKRFHFNIELRRTVAIHVYRNNEPLNISTTKSDMRFPDFQEIPEIYATNIATVPMMNFQNETIGIFEMFRDNCVDYDEIEFRKFQFLAKWMAEGMQQNKTAVIYERVNKITDILSKNLQNNFGKKYQKHNDDFLNKLVITAKLAFDAESASVFLKNVEGELYKEVTTESLSELNSSKLRLRLGKELQLAKITADSNVIINYKDVYNDARFDNEIDIKTGKIIRSVLATPIRVDNKKKFGTLQVINKLNDEFFTIIDEDFMKTFDDYTSLWLHYRWTCNEINNFRILSDILKEMIFKQWEAIYDSKGTFSIDETIYMPNNFLSFEFYPSPDHTLEIPKYIYYMILITCKETLTSNRLPLYCFVDIVKRCYVGNDYSDFFENAFLAVHFIFVFIKRYEHENTYVVLTEAEKFSLMVAAFCSFIDCDTKLIEYIDNKRKHLIELYEKYAMERHQIWLTKILITSSKLIDHFTVKDQQDILKMIEEFMLSLNFQSLIHTVLKNRLMNEINDQEKNSRQFIKKYLVRASLCACFVKKPQISIKTYLNIVKQDHQKRVLLGIIKENDIQNSLELCNTMLTTVWGGCLETFCKNFSFLESVLRTFNNFTDNVRNLKADVFDNF